MSRHDQKRAARFEARGVGEADLPYASTGYLGDAGGSCALCDHAIMHQFLLSFARPGGETVEFFPVGSKCIKDWVKAMPESVARTEALARLKRAEKAMRDQRKVLKALTDDGDEDAANLMRIFFRLPPAVRGDKDEPLGDIGSRVTRYKSFSSDGQRRYFAKLVRDAARAHGVDARAVPGSGRQAQAPAASDLCVGDERGAALMARYQALPAGFAEQTGGALFDIGSKVERYRSFASDRQRNFFAKLVRDAERDAPSTGSAPAPDSDTPPPPPAAGPPPTPATAPVTGDLFSDDDPSEPYEDPF